MADNRLKKIKIDASGKWVEQVEKIIDDIIGFYSDFPTEFGNIDELIIDVVLQPEQKNAHLFLLEAFAQDVYQIVRFYPFLISLEKFELMVKCEKAIDLLMVEKINQGKAIESPLAMSLDDFIDLLILQKRHIVDDLTENI